jgi:integrase
MKTFKYVDAEKKATYGIEYHDSAGKRIRRIVADTKKQAEDIGAEIQVELREGRYFDRKAEKEVTIDKVAALHLEAFKNRPSVVSETALVGAVLSFFKGRLVSSISRADLDSFRNARIDATRKTGRRGSPSTVNHELWMLKKLVNRAVESGYLRGAPFVIKKKDLIPCPKGRVSYLELAEARALLEAARASTRSPLLYPVVLTALETGMRRGEILGLKWADVDLKLRKIYLGKCADTGASQVKDGDRRFVPISEKLARTLQVVIRILGNPYVFPGPDGKPMHDNRTGFALALEAAGITRSFHFHDLRHTFATHALLGGTPIEVLAKILGHSTTAMTEIYAHVLAGREQAAVECLPNWGVK